MVERIVLHVGPRKTGTTFLQRAMLTNREWLNEQGFVVPFGHDKRLLETAFSLPGAGHHDDESATLRTQLLEEVHTAPRVAVLSSELLSATNQKTLRALIDDLPPVPIDVVFAIRDLGRQIPAVWQQDVRAGGIQTFEEYLDALTDPGHRFWLEHRPQLAFERWASLGTHLTTRAVVIPSQGASPELLWHRFCEAIGLNSDGSTLDRQRTNESIGMLQAEVLRRVNLALGGRLSRPESATVTRALTLPVLQKAPQKVKITVPASRSDWLHSQHEVLINEINAHDHLIVGTSAELRLNTLDPGQTSLSDAELVDESTRALAETLVTLDKTTTRATRRHERSIRQYEKKLRQAERTIRQYEKRLRHSAGKVEQLKQSAATARVPTVKLPRWRSVLRRIRRHLNRLRSA